MMNPDTYETPSHGWTCFHCGETFKNMGGARDHFGAKIDAIPGCMIRVQLGSERGLLMALRKVEEELAVLYRERADEDTPLHRELARLQSRHSDALQSAEEAGYARGLRAATHADATELEAAYAVGVASAASMIWQSIQKGPGGTPEWDLREVHRPGGGFYWESGDKRERFDWPVVFGPDAAVPPYVPGKLMQDWES